MTTKSEKMGASQADLTRLPKWAQSHIEVLRMRLDEANKRNDALSGQLPTNTFWRSGYGFSPLPDGSLVRFVLGPSASSPIENCIYARIEGDKLYVNASGKLVILPEAVNSARLTTI